MFIFMMSAFRQTLQRRREVSSELASLSGSERSGQAHSELASCPDGRPFNTGPGDPARFFHFLRSVTGISS